MMIKELLENNTPFAVMQYFENLKSLKKESRRKYELIYINEKKELAFKILKKEEVTFLKENLDEIKPIINNVHGRVYEFNNFKKYKEANFIHH